MNYTNSMNDNIIFVRENMPMNEKSYKPPYFLLIVDDEEEIHTVTKLALSDYDFEGAALEILSAYSAEEAKQILKRHPDIGVILLDVVMETENAGLMLADYIRNELLNKATRIILRTGQPGSAPETKVIREYDINDYKAKTDLTAQRLFTAIHTALRSYRDIRTLEKSKRCLEKIIKVSRKIFEKHLLEDYIYATLENLIAVLSLDESAIITLETRALNIHSSKVEYYSKSNPELQENFDFAKLDPGVRKMIDAALTEERNIYEGNRFLIYCKNQHNVVLFMAEGTSPLMKEDIELMELFARNIQTALDNIMHMQKLNKN